MFTRNYPKFWDYKSLYTIFLLPITALFIFFTFLREIFVKTKKFPAPVICIGNATIGGTGKTSLIKALGEYLLVNKKKKLVVISKGYGGNYVIPTIIEPNFPTSYAGDEAVEIADSLFQYGDITIIVAHNPKDCMSLLKQIKPDVILFDDGLQNPSFYKDFKILMVDGIRGFGNNLIIPSGPMRVSPSKAIKNSDIVAVCNATDTVKAMLQDNASDKLIEISKHTNIAVSSAEEVFLVCAIGNPKKFFTSVEKHWKIIGKLAFPDHHKYENKDVEEMIKLARSAGATKIVTTAKDYVKLRELKFEFDLIVATEHYHNDDIAKIYEKISAKIPI